MLCLLRPFFKGRKLHYMVIGGWLPQFIQTYKFLYKVLKKFDGIYVETSVMKSALEAMGLDNVVVIPNCKQLPCLTQQELVYTDSAPYKLCTFSRVMKQMGIEDAVEAVKAINTQRGETVYALDIYGQIDPNETAWFEDLQKTFPDYIAYKGMAPFDQSVEILKDYFCLLFPTRFYTEGIPGTIIDAYAAGVPVISAKWESFCDVVDDTQTGYGYEFENTAQLQQLLEDMANQPEKINSLKENCLRKYEDYTPAQAIKLLQKQMEG